jgi:hypothetical protein
VTPLAHLLRRPVPLDLAGERWQANPLRLSDLADLAILACQAWARPVAPDADPSTPEGAAAWRAACDAAEPPPPDWGSDACTTVALGTTPGRLAILGAVLRDHGLSFEDVQAVAEQMTADEWAAVVAVAFASDPREEVEARLNLALGVPPFKPEKRRTLAEAVASAAVELGCAPSALGEWTVAEWREYQQGGKAAELFMGPDPETDPERFAHYEAEVQPRHEAFFSGGSGEVPPAASPPSGLPLDPPAPAPTPTDPPRP